MKTVSWDRNVALEIIAGYERRPELLVQMLVAFARRFGHVPAEATALLADELNLSRADVHGVVSYYHDFRREPPGQHVLKVCQAEACRAVGAANLDDDTRATCGLGIGESNEMLTIEPVYCLGNCALGPAAMLDGRPLARLDRAQLETLLAGLRETVS
jgi:formate dehydrogenase subunit gamma